MQPQSVQFCANKYIINIIIIICDQCDRWTHIRCCGFPPDQYEQLNITDEEIPFLCPSCCLSALPQFVDTTESTLVMIWIYSLAEEVTVDLPQMTHVSRVMRRNM